MKSSNINTMRAMGISTAISGLKFKLEVSLQVFTVSLFLFRFLCCSALTSCTRTRNYKDPLHSGNVGACSTNRELKTALFSSGSLGQNENSEIFRRRQSYSPSYRLLPGADTDFRPKRFLEPDEKNGASYHDYTNRDWGIEKIDDPPPEFPDTVEKLADDAFDAIAASLCGTQSLDPNFASNAMARNTIYDYRPVRTSSDSGRIGVEVDGGNFLKMYSGVGHQQGKITSNFYNTNGNAIRQFALVLARKLSQTELGSNLEDEDDTSATPVAVFFNTVKQALIASRQLQVLKRTEVANCEVYESSYDNITIFSLGQEDDIPVIMKKPCHKRKKSKPGPKTKKTKQSPIKPNRGIVIVVQPTDFNEEYRPPGPAIGAAGALQKLVIRASLEELPVIMISPRFLVKSSPFSAGYGKGWDQSAGSHQSATYGGLEPPNGPTPWILRDFTPPVYCWIGDALSLDTRARYQLHVSGSREIYSRVALTHSVTNEGHPWHLFAAKSDSTTRQSSYEYMASTKISRGRPTRAILRQILTEFATESR